MKRPVTKISDGRDRGLLTDAGALLALLVLEDKWHEACLRVADASELLMLTTQLVFGEAMYLMGKRYGYPGQERLWEWVRSEDLRVIANTQEELARMDVLMKKYENMGRGGMDLGDASLVAAAETLGLRDILTIDEHFYNYQLADKSYLSVRPGGTP